MRLRNTSKAFLGKLKINTTSESELDFLWTNKNDFAHLKANLKNHRFTIESMENGRLNTMYFY